MPSRKQRRRREKLKRHEYEYVVETDEGEEVVESPRAREPKDERRPRRNGKAPRTSGKGPLDRRGRRIPQPSLQRSLKRGLLFFPIALAFVFFTGRELTIVQKVTQAILLFVILVPVLYFTDRLVYRAAERRQGAPPPRRGKQR